MERMLLKKEWVAVLMDTVLLTYSNPSLVALVLLEVSFLRFPFLFSLSHTEDLTKRGSDDQVIVLCGWDDFLYHLLDQV